MDDTASQMRFVNAQLEIISDPFLSKAPCLTFMFFQSYKKVEIIPVYKNDNSSYKVIKKLNRPFLGWPFRTYNSLSNTHKIYLTQR